ncbi:hypothetical protein Hsw_3646 [Hymenobacter swuensis DY53]|uniref:Uncharacterized protein n=1 Tax=Hymenobacter swuensis DY53 TaxID=1227739 RepID=W8F9B0_9BACT|nr:hypothetical protein Hsw_3646 [Hymenobacter swuensis DY53]
MCFAVCCPIGAAALVLLAGCSGNTDSEAAATVPPPTGHYEGPISYQGAELRVALELREISPGKLQAEVSFPQLPGLEFEAARTSYQAPQLRLEQLAAQQGGITVQAVREGDFLRGVLRWDSLQADFVWVRRGEAAARGFREQVFAVPGTGFRRLRLLLPDDTLPQHPALVLLAPPPTVAAAGSRAVYLARRGFVTVVVPVAAASDSATAQTTAAVLATVRRQVGVDSSRVGYWGRGPATVLVAAAAGQLPQPGFVVLEGASAATRAEAQLYQVLSQQRIPTLSLYASLDTTVQVQASARRLRTALGYRKGTQVRIIPQATADFLQPGRTRSDGQWQWPQPAAGYWPGLTEWLGQR